MYQRQSGRAPDETGCTCRVPGSRSGVRSTPASPAAPYWLPMSAAPSLEAAKAACGPPQTVTAAGVSAAAQRSSPCRAWPAHSAALAAAGHVGRGDAERIFTRKHAPAAQLLNNSDEG